MLVFLIVNALIVDFFQRNFTLCQLLSQLKITKSGAFNPALTTSFDSIKLEQLLDRGASGEVHRGVWQNNDVAVKVCYWSGAYSNIYSVRVTIY